MHRESTHELLAIRRRHRDVRAPGREFDRVRGAAVPLRVDATRRVDGERATKHLLHRPRTLVREELIEAAR